MTLGQFAAKLSLLPKNYRDLDRTRVSFTFHGETVMFVTPDLPAVHCVGNVWYTVIGEPL